MSTGPGGAQAGALSYRGPRVIVAMWARCPGVVFQNIPEKPEILSFVCHLLPDLWISVTNYLQHATHQNNTSAARLRPVSYQFTNPELGHL